MAPRQDRRRGEARTRLRRHKLISYRESDSSDEDLSPPVPRPLSRSTRSSQRLLSYREDDTTEDTSGGTTDHSSDVTSPHGLIDPNTRPQRPRKPASRLLHRQTTRTLGKVHAPSPKRRKTNALESRQIATDNIQFTGSIPKWQGLPYHVLLQIFIYASRPLYGAFSRPNPSIQWLLDTSMLCKSFHEAAISALFLSPPLSPAFRAHALLDLLSKPQNELSMEYRNKIRRLDVETRQVLIKKAGPSLGYFDLAHLLTLTPQLKALHLYHSYDELAPSVQHSIVSHNKWSYPEVLFNALESVRIQLESWEWNGRFPDTLSVLQRMPEVHTRHSFRQLRYLTLVNLSALKKAQKESNAVVDAPGNATPEDILATALATLHYLQYLQCRKCSLINDQLLLDLPETLQRVSFVQCDQLTSEGLQSFLSKQGPMLSGLQLDHNQALSLGFLSTLAISCPNLRHLKMDLTYYDASSFHDVEPHYEELLPLGRPSWPATLQSIDLAQLRKWEAPAAEDFFRSLIEAAPSLKDLRKLSLKAILTIPWRERATFRQKWIDKLEYVFLRCSKSPSKLQSISQSRRILAEPSKSLSRTDDSLRPLSSDSQSSRSSFRNENSNSATPSKRKSVRLAERDFETELEAKLRRRTPSARNGAAQETFRQSMCNEVTVRIDNLRPAEAQFDEGDFLDEEQSGDEDWNGEDPVPASGYAW